MIENNFKIGDKVYENKTESIGIITKITPKRGDITVDFGNWTEVFKKSGFLKNADIWSSTHICILTPEKEQEIKDRKIIAFCKNRIEKTKINADQALRIMEILQEGNADG